MKKEYYPLHVHTTFSILDGVSRQKDLIKKCKENGIPGFARTDHGNMYNAVSFYKECCAANIKPIIGIEYYVAPDSRFNRDYANKEQAMKDLESGDLSYSAYHLTVLAKNRQGYENLKELSTISHLEGFYKKPRIDMEILSTHKEGLIVLSGCLASMTSRLIIGGQESKAIELIDKQRAIFGEDFYIEIMYHNIGEEEDLVNKSLLFIANKHGIPVVITNDSHYTDKEDILAHEIALCIGTNKTLNDPSHWKFNGEGYWFKTTDEMYRLIDEASLPEECITNTVHVASKVEDYGFKLTSNKHPPQIPLFRNENGDVMSEQACASLLETKAWCGLAEKGLSDNSVYQNRMIEELNLIKRQNFSSYFLIIADVIDFMRENNFPIPLGRGSSCGSLVCYCTSITGLDPIVHGIPFSRFMNEDRDLPDIDTDMSRRHRKEVIDYIVNKYGHDRVAQIVTFQSMATLGAIDNVGRALNVPSTMRRSVSNLIGEVSKEDTVNDVVESNQKVKEMLDAVPNWVNVAAALEGNNRNLGAHAAGIVISNDDIKKYSPLIRDSKDGYHVTQYDMKDLQELGLLKLDMLGLNTLDLIYDAIRLINNRHGTNYDFHKFSLDDTSTYKTIASGKYVSVFQYDSSGIRSVAKQLNPENFDHIVALNALYRPGPMKKGKGEMSILEHYIERRHGREEIDVWHPSLRDVLAPTFGMPIFQESLMQISQIIGGFTGTEANKYRSAIAKKDKVKFDKYQQKLVDGGVNNGHSREFMLDLTNKLAGSARYNWCISHSKSYSYISYVTAWLETHYPLEYYTSLLNSSSDDNKQLKVLLSAIMQKGINVKPPDINNSRSEFHTDGESVYMGLCSVRQVGESAIEPLLSDRDNSGAYSGFVDFCVRTKHLNKKITKLTKENLLKSGAFNFDKSINLKTKLTNVELIQDIIKKFNEKMDDDKLKAHILKTMIICADDHSDQEKLDFERSVLNFYVSSHPVLQYLPLFSLFNNQRFIVPSQLEDEIVGTRSAMVGVVESVEMKTTKNGDPYLRIRLCDNIDSTNIMVWSPLATQVYNKIGGQSIIIVHGYTKDDNYRPGEKQFSVNSIVPISNGIPINSFYSQNYTDTEIVLNTLGVKAESISAPIKHVGSIVILKNVAFIKPEMFDNLKNLSVTYQLHT